MGCCFLYARRDDLDWLNSHHEMSGGPNEAEIVELKATYLRTLDAQDRTTYRSVSAGDLVYGGGPRYRRRSISSRLDALMRLSLLRPSVSTS